MRRSLGYRLMLGVGTAAALVTIMAAALVFRSYQRVALDDAGSYAEQISETIRRATRHDMLLNHRESLHEIIETIGEQEGIQKVRIYNKEGAIILSTDRDDVGRMVDLRAEACFACHAQNQPLTTLPIAERRRVFRAADGSRMLGVINPIGNEPACSDGSCHAHAPEQTVLGVLDVTVPLDPIDAEIRSSARQLIVLVVAAVLLLSLIIGWFVQRTMLRRMSLVADATRRVAGGELSYRIPEQGQDELGDLARSFNRMTEKLALAQRQLVQSDKLASVGRLAAGVAHEINNPLTGVLTYASLLRKRFESDPEVCEDLDVIVAETKRCRDITKGLLDFSRQSVPHKKALHLSEIIQRSASIVRNQFALRKVKLVLDLQEGLPAIEADANQMQQVLVNLLVNASDSMKKEGGTVTIRTSAEEAPEGAQPSTVRVEVSDTGAGIPEELRTQVFEPFYTTKGQQGNGLGLAIVWGIVEGHRGTISFESELGRGTTFAIALPVKSAATPLIVP